MIKIENKEFTEKQGYYSLEFGNYELTLEPCLNGFDVAIYDNYGNLLEPKKCTKTTLKPEKTEYRSLNRVTGELNDNFRLVAIPKALIIASKIYKKYKSK